MTKKICITGNEVMINKIKAYANRYLGRGVEEIIINGEEKNGQNTECSVGDKNAEVS
jgi:hypothetical protein